MVAVWLCKSQEYPSASFTFCESYRIGGLRSAVLEAVGLARIFGTYREIAKGEEKIRIFEDRDEALQWVRHGD